MLYSEHPWAMARMLMLARASAENMVAATPLRRHMSWPTAASTQQPSMASTLEMRPALRASAKRALSAARARGASACLTAKHTECSDDAWEGRVRRVGGGDWGGPGHPPSRPHLALALALTLAPALPRGLKHPPTPARPPGRS